jgi:hypothetical protein
MSTESQATWRLPTAATVLMLGAAILAAPAKAGEGLLAMSHACFANDSIVMGKRLAPRPDVIQARLNSPACHDQSGLNDPSAEDTAAIQRELDRIDENLTSLYRDEVASTMPASAN